MKVLRRIADVRRFLKAGIMDVVLVPTMGALHQGHAALIRHARERAGSKGTVVVSIFVNPTQFGPNEDFLRYPRPFESDQELCAAEGADALFAPSAEEMYYPDRSVWVDEELLSRGLCGASRPGHFRGVCTVVTKLFNIMQPVAAVFGEKDWQQLAIIRRMVRDLNFPVEIVAHPTVREPDGVAVSSRNAYLSAEARAHAPRIYAALAAEAMSPSSPAAIASAVCRRISEIPGARVDYAACVDAESLDPAVDRSRPITLAVAVFLGRTRLIDNIQLPPIP